MEPFDHRSFTRPLIVISLVTFGCYFAVSMRLPIVPLHARGVGVSTAQIGFINSAFYLIAGLLSLPSGALSDLFGKKRLAVIGAVILCAGMFLLCFCRSYLQFAALYLMLGAGTAAFGPTMMAWVAQISPPTHLGRAYGWYTTALFCGLGIGPAAGGAIGKWFGFLPVFLTGGAVVAVVLWATVRFLPSTPGPQHTREDRGGWKDDLGMVFSNRPLLGSWAATFGACIIAGTFFSFLPLHADIRGLDVHQIGFVFLVQSVTNALSRIPFGAFSDRVGHRSYQALAGIALVTVSIAAFGPARTYFQFILAGFGLGVSMAVAFTSIGALIAETVEPRFRGFAMGGYNACIYFGLMAGSIGMGPLIEGIGFTRGFLWVGAANLPFVAIFAWAMRGYTRHRNRP
jgi:MFS family permease